MPTQQKSEIGKLLEMVYDLMSIKDDEDNKDVAF